MKLKLSFFIMVNLFIAALRVICILVGLLLGGRVLLPLLEAVGTGLLAAAGVNLLDRSLSLEAPDSRQRVQVVAETRTNLPDEIVDLKCTAGYD